MSKSIFLLYETDNFHARSSKRLIGVTTTEYNTSVLVRRYCANNDIKLSNDALHNLFKNQQTQGLASVFELLIEEVIINQLID